MTGSKLIDYLSWTVLIIALIQLWLSERYMENIIDAKGFLLCYGSVSLLLAGMLSLLHYRLHPSYFRHASESRGSAVLSLFFGLLINFLFVAAYVNWSSAEEHQQLKKVYVQEKSMNVRYRSPNVRLQIEERKERFMPAHTEWQQIVARDSLELTVGKGLLGYEVIFRFGE